MKIAIQGYPASYHAIAAETFFGSNAKLVPCDSFEEVFEGVKNNKVDYGVVAVENSLYGTINEVYDLMHDNRVWICGEIFLRIEHCLIGNPSAKRKDITEVYSHPVALAQCRKYLDKQLKNAERFEHHDTAHSVIEIKQDGSKHKAAIASKQAAKLHSMHVIQKNIEDNHQNYTRFFVLQKNKGQNGKANKTSLILKMPGDAKPGALLKALEVFAKNNINISMLHSRPIIGKAWHYMFYIDVNAGSHTDNLQNVINELNQQGCSVEILGSYQSSKQIDTAD